MIKGIYTAASGMMLQMARQDVIANNLANVNTTGYKRSSSVQQAFPTMLLNRMGEIQEISGSRVPVRPVMIGTLGTGASLNRIISDNSLGNLKQSENPTDLALTTTDTYLVVETPQGINYTRNGSLKINGEGLLTTNHGYPVLDDNGDYITLEGDFTIERMGYISVEGEEIGRLQVVRFENQEGLEKLGGSLIATDQEPQLVDNPEILQGYTEDSNVVAVQEMVTMINVMRAYEALQKIVQAEDETLQVAISEVGQVPS